MMTISVEGLSCKTFLLVSTKNIVLKTEVFAGTLFVGSIIFAILAYTSLTEQIRTVTALTEKSIEQGHVSVTIKQKAKTVLLLIKNTGASPIYEFKIKAGDSGIRFIKARGWEGSRVDRSTVIIQTNNRPINTGYSLVAILLTNTKSSYEWMVFDKNRNEIGQGIISNKVEIAQSRLNELKFDITEYSMPDATSYALVPLYDQKRNVIWISDFTHQQIWKFNLETKQFQSLKHAGESAVRLALDSRARVWFTDTRTMTFGYVDPDTNSSKIFKPPVEGFILDLKIDSNDIVWITVTDKDKIIRFDSNTESFRIIDLAEGSHPGSILIDRSSHVWFTQAESGDIGVIDPVSNKITTYRPSDGKLTSPSSMIQDTNGNIWIGEHGGKTITRFNPESLNFDRYSVPDNDALTLGLVEDKYGNIWYAEHTTDNIAVLDPKTGLTKLIRVPTGAPSVQWLTIDKEGNIWFTEPANAKIGSISILENVLANHEK